MGELGADRVKPALRELVVEASRALSRLDADRLEELALTCQVLNRDMHSSVALIGAANQRDLAGEARDAVADLAVFGRVLDATRANLHVMCRLRDLRQGRREYGSEQAPRALAPINWIGPGTENKHGDN